MRVEDLRLSIFLQVEEETPAQVERDIEIEIDKVKRERERREGVVIVKDAFRLGVRVDSMGLTHFTTLS